MPRNGSGVYSLPPGSTFTPNTLIQSSVVNGINNDLATDLNLARPIVAGGTGATTAAGALAALGAFPAASATWQLIGRYNVSPAVSAINITGISAYRTIRLIGTVFLTSASPGIFIRTSTSNGSSYDSGASDYTNQTLGAISSTVFGSTVTESGLAITRQTVFSASFETVIANFNIAGNLQATSRVFTNLSPSGFSSENNGGQRNAAVARNALQIIGSGTTLTGFVIAEGIPG